MIVQIEHELRMISLIQLLLSNLDYENMTQSDAETIDTLTEELGVN